MTTIFHWLAAWVVLTCVGLICLPGVMFMPFYMALPIAALFGGFWTQALALAVLVHLHADAERHDDHGTTE